MGAPRGGILAAMGALSVMLLGFPARAQDSELEQSLVFFELYIRADGNVGAKSPDYTSGIQRDIRQFRKFSLLPRADAALRIRQEMLPAAAPTDTGKLAGITDRLSRGVKTYYQQQTQAIALLEGARRDLLAIADTVPMAPALRKLFFDAEMMLALGYLETSRPGPARKIVEETARRFGSAYEVSDKFYHPDVVKVWLDVSKRLKGERTAEVTVSTNPAGCTVLLNGVQMPQKTPFTYGDLFPGTVRIQVVKGDMRSTVRKVTLAANGKARVDVDLEYENALTFGEGRFGLTFSTQESFKRSMMTYATKLGRFLKVDLIALTGVVRGASGHELVAYLVDVRKRTLLRKDAWVVRPNVVSPRRTLEAAAFVAGVKPPDKVPTYRAWYKNWLGWTLTGTGLAALGTGVAFYVQWIGHKDNASDLTFGDKTKRLGEKDKADEAALIGNIMTGVGAALVVGGVLAFTLWKVEEPDALGESAMPSFTAAPIFLPGGGGFGATWTF